MVVVDLRGGADIKPIVFDNGSPGGTSPCSQPDRRRVRRSFQNLGGTLLRFQRADRTRTHRETALHTSESGRARAGGVSGTLALEQFSSLRVRRSRPGESERVARAQDEGATSGGSKPEPPSVSAVRRPRSRKARDVRHPVFFLFFSFPSLSHSSSPLFFQ